MKFPDDTSLMKHVGRKKQCLERHNMGHVDPTLVRLLPIFGRETAVDVTFLTFQSEQENSSRHEGTSATGYVNSYATYAFPHSTNSNGANYSTTLPLGLGDNNSQNSVSMAFADEEDSNSAQFSPSNNYDSSELSTRDDQPLLDNASIADDESWLPNSSSMEHSSSEEEEDYHHEDNDPNVEAARNCLKSIADMIRRRSMKTFLLPTDVQIVMDLYQRLVGNGSSLNAFDDVLDWAIHHSLFGDHVPRRKPMIKQVSEAVYGKEFLRLH